MDIFCLKILLISQRIHIHSSVILCHISGQYFVEIVSELFLRICPSSTTHFRHCGSTSTYVHSSSFTPNLAWGHSSTSIQGIEDFFRAKGNGQSS